MTVRLRLLFLLPSAFFLAFAPSFSQTPTFRAGTTLVEITFVAQDDKGNPVTDLKQDEIVLTDGGRKRDIAFFRFDGVPSTPLAATTLPPLPAGYAANSPISMADRQPHVIAIVFDFLNTAPPQQTEARAQALQYLETLPPDTQVALFRFSEQNRIDLIQPFTDSVEAVRARIASMPVSARRELVRPGRKGNPIVGGECGPEERDATAEQAAAVTARAPVEGKEIGMGAFGESEKRAISALNQNVRDLRIASTLENLETLGGHLSGIPGRKNVIWITSGMPIVLSPTRYLQGQKNYEPLLRQTAQRLATQGLAVYPVDAKGGCRAMDRTNTAGNDQGEYGLNDAPERVFASLNTVADITGGRVRKFDNDLIRSVATAANDQRGAYVIGFYAEDATTPWRRVTVDVARPRVAVRHGEGYLARANTPPVNLAPGQWQSLARQPLESSSIRLRGRAERTSAGLRVLLEIAATDLLFQERAELIVADLELGLVEKTADGPTNVRQQPLEITLKTPGGDRRASVIPVETIWSLNTGTSTVRLIVRDRATGRVGTLEVAVE